MNHSRFQSLSATFIAIAISAGCTAGADEYGLDPAALGAQEALGSYVGGIEETPHLTAQQIQTVVRAEFPQYGECYEGLLLANPTAAGRISLKFTVNPDGSMAETTVGSVEGDLVDADFQQCMLSATETLIFPVAAQQTNVVYPILMTPSDDS